jgi:membrane protein DedA with SNARE-associated domain
LWVDGASKTHDRAGMKDWLVRFLLGVFAGATVGALFCNVFGPSMLTSIPDLTTMFSASMCACKETAEKTTSWFAKLELISMALGALAGGTIAVAISRRISRRQKAAEAEAALAARTAPPPAATPS